MKKIGGLILVIFSITLWSTSLCWALTDLEIRNEIQGVLKIRHPSESAIWWKSLGPHAPNVIISLYQESQNIYHRVRLIDALSWYDDPGAIEFLKNEAETQKNHVIQAAAVRAIGTSQGVKEREYLSDSLQNESLQVRKEAFRHLQRFGTDFKQSFEMAEESLRLKEGHKLKPKKLLKERPIH